MIIQDNNISNDSELHDLLALSVDVCEPSELAGMVDWTVQNGIDLLSVLPDAVPIIWPWIENKKIKILNRFYITDIQDKTLFELAQDIKAGFKYGADGTQIFIKIDLLKEFTDSLVGIRCDLFFNHELDICFDIADVEPSEYGVMFDCLKRIGANSIGFVLKKDAGIHSDFVGRVFGLLNAWPDDLMCDVHFFTGENTERIHQTYRLVKSECPNLLDKIRFFIDY